MSNQRKSLDQWTDEDWLRAYAQNGTAHTVSWQGAVLFEADLSGVSLRRANLCEADLRGASLCEADLYGAILSGANLYGAILSGANLYGVSLRRANLCEADLYGASLSGANLYGAIGIVSISGIGRARRGVYFVQHSDCIMVQAGCFWGSAEKLLERSAETHGTDSRHYAAYQAAVRLAKASLDDDKP